MKLNFHYVLRGSQCRSICSTPSVREVEYGHYEKKGGGEHECLQCRNASAAKSELLYVTSSPLFFYIYDLEPPGPN